MAQKSFDELHELIRLGHLDEVQQYVKNNPPDKYFYNSAKESAARTALVTGNLDMYEALASQGISLGHHELDTWILENVDYNTRRTLKNIHRNYTKTPKILKLLNLSSLAYDTPDDLKQMYFESVFIAYGKLAEWKWTDDILQLVSTSDDNLRIIFDFERSAVNMMDPTQSKRARGATRFEQSNFVYIGANGLLKPATSDYNEVLGTLIHELCHVAMMIVFNNDCKPYVSGDVDAEEKFEKVVQICKEKKVEEDIIDCVFDYHEKVCHAELIARVAQFIALYHDKTERFLKVKDTFIELFIFFKGNTLESINNENSLLKAKQELRQKSKTISKLQTLKIALKAEEFRSIFSLDEVTKSVESSSLVIRSNIGLVTLKAIFDEVKQRESLDSFIFIDSDAFKNEKDLHLIRKVNELCSKPILIVDCADDSVDKLLTSCLYFRDFKRTIFVAKNDSSSRLKDVNINIKDINHEWRQLTNESQSLLRKARVQFQGTSKAFEDLFETSDETKFDISSLVNAFIRNREVMVGDPQEVFDEMDLYIDRKLVFENGETLPNFNDLKRRKIEKRRSKVLQDNNETKVTQMFTYFYQCNLKKTAIISGEIGSGKSLVLKSIAQKLRDIDPAVWIVFMELKKLKKLYNPTRSDEIKTFLTDQVLRLNDFERSIFVQMFDQNRVVILMDGIDEVSQRHKSFFLRFITSLAEVSKVKLLVTSRSQLASGLKLSTDVQEFHIKPFSDEEQKRFYEQVFTRKCPRNENIAKRLSWISRFSSIKNPLVMKVLASTVARIDNFEDLNLYVFYDSFLKKIVGRFFISQGSEGIEKYLDQNFSIIEFFEKKAFEQLRFSQLLPAGFTSTCFEEDKIYLEDNAAYSGLLRLKNDGTYCFTHESFASFFAAKFIANVIWGKGSRSMNRTIKTLTFEVLINLINQHGEFLEVKSFLNDFLKSQHVETDFSAFNKSADLKKIQEIDLIEIQTLRLDELHDFFSQLSMRLNDQHKNKQKNCVDTQETPNYSMSSFVIFLPVIATKISEKLWQVLTIANGVKSRMQR